MTLRRRRKSTGATTIIFVILMLFLAVSYKRIELDSKDTYYTNRVLELEELIKDEETREQQLDELRIYMQTKKYIEEVARKKLGLVKEDEIIFKSKQE